MALEVTMVNLLHLAKADSPILSTFSPIVTLSIWAQPLNALLPMEVTELGMVTSVKPVQPSNALLPIFVTELPMTRFFSDVRL